VTYEYVPTRYGIQNKLRDEQTKVELTGQKGWLNTFTRGMEYATLPFTAAGAALHGMTTGKDISGGFKEWLPEGKIYEQYKELPFWQQMLWEAPTILLPGVGIGGRIAKGLSGAGKAVKAAKSAAEAARIIARETGEDEAVTLMRTIIGEERFIPKSLRKEIKLLQKAHKAKIAVEQEAIMKAKPGEQGIYMAKAAGRGELPTVAFKPGEIMPDDWFDRLIKFGEARIDSGIVSPTSKVYEKFHLQEGLQRMLRDFEAPTASQEALLIKIFGTEFVNKAIQQNVKSEHSVAKTILDIANVPRAVLSSYDLSNPLRNSVVLFARNPIQGIKNFKYMLRALKSEEDSAFIMNAMKTDPEYAELIQKFRLDITEMAGKLGAREEAFPSAFAELIPGVRASNRAYTVYANKMRFDNGIRQLHILNKVDRSLKTRAIEVAMQAGKELSDAEIEAAGLGDDVYKGMGQLINWASGRGSMGFLQGAAPAMNAFLFSPRLIFARLELPFKLFSRNKYIRQEAWRMFIPFMGGGASILALAKTTGVADIELDPRSSDFGKMRVGDTRLDVWAGFAQYARFLSQLVSSERKVVTTGQTQELNRKDILYQFMESKTSPIVGLILDLLAGRTYVGEELTVEAETIVRQIKDRLMPLAWQDMMDAIANDQATGGALATAGFLGVGVTSYPPRNSPSPGTLWLLSKMKGNDIRAKLRRSTLK